MTRFTVVDPFAGPGGMNLGFTTAGWWSLAAIEPDQATAETYAANHPSVELVRRDARHVPACELQGIAWRRTGRHEVDAVVGGPPCQIHSYGGSGRVDYDPARLFLYRELIRVAVGLRAKILLIENVDGITTKRLGPDSERFVLDQLRLDLDAAGFVNRREYLLNAWHFGVPQNRWRWFSVSSRLPHLRLRPPQPSPLRPTVGEAFADLPDQAGVTEYRQCWSGYSLLMRGRISWPLAATPDELTWHVCPPHSDRMVERFKLVPQGRKLYQRYRQMSEAERAGLRAMGVLPPKAPHKQTAARLALNKPSWTVTSHVEGHLLHPTQHRPITAREAARLQSFPDHYRFRGRLTGSFNAATRSVYAQIGSAVPPLMARAWGITIRRILEEGEAGRVTYFLPTAGHSPPG